jgi:hypothetical protein
MKNTDRVEARHAIAREPSGEIAAPEAADT